MSSTINQLTETTSTEDLYVLGTQNNQSVKYNLEAIDNKIDKYNDIQGGGEIHEYSSSNNYYKGSYIKLNNKIYRVTEDIYAGESIEGKIVETSVFSEFQTIKGTGSTETLDVQILTSDNNTSPTILQNNVSIKFSDGTTQQVVCDSTGHGSLSIAKGRVYSASVANQAGYHTPGAYNNIKASLSQRTLQFVYTRQWEGTSVITIELSVSNGGVLNDFVGRNLVIFEDNSENYWNSTNGVIENGKVIYTFPGITSGKAYTIPIFHDSSSNIYTINNRKYTNTSIENSLNIVPNTEYETLRVGYRLISQNYGIFIVKNDGTEIEIGSWEGPDPTDTDKKNTWPLLHINTEDCANTGNDYYVRCRDLTSERLASECTNKQWCTARKRLPNVSTNATTEYNGRKQTYYMCFDSRNLGLISPAAEFAYKQTIELSGIQVHGYIGTKPQMSVIYKVENDQTVVAIKNTLTKLGYSNPNYVIINVNWSSSQGGEAWSWAGRSGGGFWTDGYTGSYPVTYSNALVVPFFTLP